MGPAVLAFLTTFATLFLLQRSALSQALADTPNDRSLHTRTTPRIGGIGIAVVAACTVFVPQRPGWATAWLIAYLLLALVSVADDRMSLPAGTRLLVHAVVATAWLASVDLSWFWYVFATLAIIWSTNLFNFMDGSDGVAGGMALIGLATLAWAANAAAGYASTTSPLAASYVAQLHALSVICLCMAAAAAAFLCFNFPPASLFLGDVGSIPLGFSAAALAIAGIHLQAWSLFFPVIAFFPFLFDATLTLGVRALRGKKLTEAHRQHCYQRVILAGLSKRQLCLRLYPLMLICALLAVTSRHFPLWGQALIILGQTLVGMVIALTIHATSPPERS